MKMPIQREYTGDVTKLIHVYTVSYPPQYDKQTGESTACFDVSIVMPCSLLFSPDMFPGNINYPHEC